VPSSNDENRRRSPRLHHEVPVAYRSEGSFLTDWATDISRGGLFINTRKPLAVGTVVKLILQLPGAAFPFDVSGRVTRAVELDERGSAPAGMAIEFLDLDVERRARIEELVERLRRELGAV
jgi:type IV pilus assembly protein PilZ